MKLQLDELTVYGAGTQASVSTQRRAERLCLASRTQNIDECLISGAKLSTTGTWSVQAQTAAAISAVSTHVSPAAAVVVMATYLRVGQVARRVPAQDGTRTSTSRTSVDAPVTK